MIALARSLRMRASARWSRPSKARPRCRGKVRRTDQELALPPIFAEAAARTASSKITRRSARLPSNTTITAIAWVPVLRRQLDDAATFDADAYDDARRTARRARQALPSCLRTAR